MLQVVAAMAVSTDFEVMAYSADEKRFILHLIYSDGYFSHAVHYQVGNADCATFYLARHLQIDYDKMIIIGDMRFNGPSPFDKNPSKLFYQSLSELKELVKGKRVSVISPQKVPEGIHSILGNRSSVFKNKEELKKILETQIRAY